MSPIENEAPSISNILKYLINEKIIPDINEISKEANIPYHSLYKIVNGHTADPKISTINSLSKYLKIPLEALLGTIPIQSVKGAYRSNRFTYSIPKIEFEYIWDWSSRTKITTDREWFSTAFELSDDSFCTELHSNSLPKPFNTPMMLMLDPSLEGCDGDIGIIINTIDKSSFLGTLINHAGAKFGKAMIDGFSPVKIDDIKTLFIKAKNISLDIH